MQLYSQSIDKITCCQTGSRTKTMGNNPDQPDIRASSAQRRRLATHGELGEAVITLLEQAQRNIMIFGPSLDGNYFNTTRAADALGQFISRHAENRVRILVENEQQVLRDNTRLVAMARRFGDSIHIRHVGEDHVGLRELFVISDSRGFLYQENVDRLESIVDYQGPGDATLLARRFYGMWDMSEPAASINVIGL